MGVDGAAGSLGVATCQRLVQLGVDAVLPLRQRLVVRAAARPNEQVAVVQVVPEFQQSGQPCPLHDDRMEAVVILHDLRKIPRSDIAHLLQYPAQGAQILLLEFAVKIAQRRHFQICPQQIDLVGVLRFHPAHRAPHIARILDHALLFQLPQRFPDGCPAGAELLGKPLLSQLYARLQLPGKDLASDSRGDTFP